MQVLLFPELPSHLPAGAAYEAEFINANEEQRLLAFIAALPLQEAQYKRYTARRRVVSYGGVFDYDALTLKPAGALPAELEWLRDHASARLGVAPHDFTHALVAEYRPGTPLGWHRDVPEFESVRSGDTPCPDSPVFARRDSRLLHGRVDGSDVALSSNVAPSDDQPLSLRQ
ncbi:MAG: hypothetical protein ABI605_15120 [Rhizobacter sp.]